MNQPEKDAAADLVGAIAIFLFFGVVIMLPYVGYVIGKNMTQTSESPITTIESVEKQDYFLQTVDGDTVAICTSSSTDGYGGCVFYCSQWNTKGQCEKFGDGVLDFAPLSSQILWNLPKQLRP